MITKTKQLFNGVPNIKYMNKCFFYQCPMERRKYDKNHTSGNVIFVCTHNQPFKTGLQEHCNAFWPISRQNRVKLQIFHLLTIQTSLIKIRACLERVQGFKWLQRGPDRTQGMVKLIGINQSRPLVICTPLQFYLSSVISCPYEIYSYQSVKTSLG